MGFGFSAVSLILLQVGFDCPVTHHMTLPGGVAGRHSGPAADH